MSTAVAKRARKKPKQDWNWAKKKLVERLRNKERVWAGQPGGFPDRGRIMAVDSIGITIGSGSRFRVRGYLILSLGADFRKRVHYHFWFRRRDDGGWTLFWALPERPRAQWVRGPCRRCDKTYHLREPFADKTACGRAFKSGCYSVRRSAPNFVSRKARRNRDWCRTCENLVDMYEVKQ